MRNKLLSIFFSACLLFSFLSCVNIYACAAGNLTFNDGTLTYTILSKSTVGVGTPEPGSGLYDKSKTDITIPISVSHGFKKYSVTCIMNDAFKGCGNITNINILDPKEDISSHACKNCMCVPNKSFEGLTYIGNEAFAYCSNLKNITLQATITYVGEKIFYGCTSLEKICLPNSLTKLPRGTFYGCSSLSDIKIPHTITSIDEETFFGCTNLIRICLPNNLTKISDCTFSNCYNLLSISIPKNVKSIGSSAFSGCKSITSVIIPPAVKNIGNHAFVDCDRLAYISINRPSSYLHLGLNWNGNAWVQ